MVVMFYGSPSATIICFSPTNISEVTDFISFYNELSSLVRNIPKHNVLMIGGDINAQIVENVHNKFNKHICQTEIGKIWQISREKID